MRKRAEEVGKFNIDITDKVINRKDLAYARAISKRKLYIEECEKSKLRVFHFNGYTKVTKRESGEVYIEKNRHIENTRLRLDNIPPGDYTISELLCF